MRITISDPSALDCHFPSFNKASQIDRPRSSLGFSIDDSRPLENKQLRPQTTQYLHTKRLSNFSATQLAVVINTGEKVSKLSYKPNTRRCEPKGIGRYTRLPPLNKGPKMFAQILHDASRTRYWSKDRKVTQMFVWALTRRLLQIGKEASLSPQKAWVHTILANYRARILSDPFNLRTTYRVLKVSVLKPRIVNATNARLRCLLAQIARLSASMKSDNATTSSILRRVSRGRSEAAPETSSYKVEYDSHQKFMDETSEIHCIQMTKTRRFLRFWLEKSASIDDRLNLWKAEVPKEWSQH